MATIAANGYPYAFVSINTHPLSKGGCRGNEKMPQGAI
jgi:hypothetical protein